LESNELSIKYGESTDTARVTASLVGGSGQLVKLVADGGDSDYYTFTDHQDGTGDLKMTKAIPSSSVKQEIVVTATCDNAVTQKIVITLLPANPPIVTVMSAYVSGSLAVGDPSAVATITVDCTYGATAPTALNGFTDLLFSG
jgi:hypothetical protein